MTRARLLAFAVWSLAACGDPVIETDAGFVQFDGAPTCASDQTLCDGRCVNVDNNALHCGGCGRACPSGQFCANRGCTASCGAPLRACGSSCVDQATDRFHCGQCDRECAEGLLCSNGSCRCPANQLECPGVGCVDELSDPNNCGLCGRQCAGEQVCINGSCDCENGGILCGSTCVDEQNSVAHCGECDNDCEADEFCNAGECTCRGGEREADCSDGVDDDCDDLVDCADPDCHGQTRACQTSGSGMCSMGVQSCGTNGLWSTCEVGTGTAEICGDGIDQDCDGSDLRNPDQWEYNDTCAACAFVTATVNPNIVFNPSFDSVVDDVDCFKFTVTDASSPLREYIEIEVRDIPPGHDYDVYLYASLADCEARTPLASSTGIGNVNERISWGERFGADDGGTYYVRVRRYEGYDCSSQYTFTFNGLR